MIPLTEFRTHPVDSPEPEDRSNLGVPVGETVPFDLGMADTTDEGMDTPVRVFWWRVADMNGATAVRNLRILLSDTGVHPVTWYMDITGDWTKNKKAVQVKAGSPGEVQNDVPFSFSRMDGENLIEGTGHDQTGAYIYIVGRIGAGTPAGVIEGPVLTVEFDWK